MQQSDAARAPDGGDHPLQAVRASVFGEDRIRVLFVGDERDHSRIAAKVEGAHPGRYTIAGADALWVAEGRLVQSEYACLLLDAALPDGDGLAALERLSLVAPGVPVVLLAGGTDEALESRALHEGAQDLLPIAADGDAIDRAIRHAIDRKDWERGLAHQALHDDLTGLPNRLLLLDRLEVALTRAARSHDEVCVLFLDLDGFKAVNDTLGHQAGDDLLVAVANGLKDAVRASDTVARFGGDEFVVLSTPAQADALAYRLGEAIASALGRGEVRVSASVGIAVSRDGGERPEDLVRRADAAMYRAKDTSGFSCAVDGARSVAELDDSVTPASLARALDEGELALHYQPQFDLATGAPVAVEALLRWEHPTRGMLVPADFLGAVEAAGLGPRLFRWAVLSACERLDAWSQLVPGLRVALNVSTRQLGAPELLAALSAAFAQTGCDPSRVTVELRESALLHAGARAPVLVDALHKLGVRVALDNFGTGHASLAVLDLPLDEVKLDHSLVGELHEPPAGRPPLAEAVLEVAGALHLDAVAEGVETEEQLARLRRLGCPRGQGVLLGAVDPPERAEQALTRAA